MQRIGTALLAVALTVLMLPAHQAHAAGDAQAAAAGNPAPGLDPATRRQLAALATSLANRLAAALANGGLEDFDPGPELERSLGRALSGPEVAALVERLLAQSAGTQGGPAADLPPEVRAALGNAIRNVIAAARRDLAQELK